jgi:hypothetical protein
MTVPLFYASAVLRADRSQWSGTASSFSAALWSTPMSWNSLRQGVRQPLDLEEGHGKVCGAVWLLGVPHSDLPDLVQSTVRARLADDVVFDRQLTQAAPKDPKPAMVRHDRLLMLPALVDLDEDIRLVAEPAVERLRRESRAPRDPIRVGAQESMLVES